MCKKTMFQAEEMVELGRLMLLGLPVSLEMAGLGTEAGGSLLDFLQQIFIV